MYSIDYVYKFIHYIGICWRQQARLSRAPWRHTGSRGHISRHRRPHSSLPPRGAGGPRGETFACCEALLLSYFFLFSSYFVFHNLPNCLGRDALFMCHSPRTQGFKMLEDAWGEGHLKAERLRWKEMKSFFSRELVKTCENMWRHMKTGLSKRFCAHLTHLPFSKYLLTEAKRCQRLFWAEPSQLREEWRVDVLLLRTSSNDNLLLLILTNSY